MLAVRGLRSRKGAEEGSSSCERRRVKKRKRMRYMRRMVLRERERRRVGDLWRGVFFWAAEEGLWNHECQLVANSRPSTQRGDVTYSAFFPINRADTTPHNFISAPVATNTLTECLIARAL